MEFKLFGSPYDIYCWLILAIVIGIYGYRKLKKLRNNVRVWIDKKIYPNFVFCF